MAATLLLAPTLAWTPCALPQLPVPSRSRPILLQVAGTLRSMVLELFLGTPGVLHIVECRGLHLSDGYSREGVQTIFGRMSSRPTILHQG